MDAMLQALPLACVLLACSSSSGGAGSGPGDASNDSRTAADSGEATDSGSADSRTVDSPSDAPAPSAACTTVAGWQTGRPSATCLTCLSQAEGFVEAGAAPCGSAESSYRASCASCSATCAGSPIHLCACELACDTSSCQSLFDTLMSCLATECASYCP